MRPNLAFGPIDSIAQYLLYLSVVVLGVLLPLLANKWRTRREERRLLARTLAALLEETRGNRRRIVESLDSLRAALAVIENGKSWYLERRSEVAAGRSGTDAPPEEPEGSVGITLALITRVAWDVAHHARALPLVPDDRLQRFTRAYQMQDLYLRDRAMLLELVQQLEVLNLPADLSRTDVLDARLVVLARALLVLRYHVGLAEGMLECYEGALDETAPAAPSASPPAPAPAPASAG